MALPPGAKYVPGSKGRRVQLADGSTVTKYQADKIDYQRRFGVSVRGRRKQTRAAQNLERQFEGREDVKLNERRINQAIREGQLSREELRKLQFGTESEIRELARDSEGKWSTYDQSGRVHTTGQGTNPFWYH